ncbi:hypothetical protein BDY21DRAFT_351512 [Lineolata rhizophorae]|uniref:Uncharacterized protein n=1 Tax=Lineolata rhizophorae TaxID=578093 RepID=A0A6A6NUM7_9PEZI|nr:hypothetical protein BDY21DRAFT_351512 [Lineolata rhizophorae]
MDMRRGAEALLRAQHQHLIATSPMCRSTSRPQCAHRLFLRPASIPSRRFLTTTTPSHQQHNQDRTPDSPPKDEPQRPASRSRVASLLDSVVGPESDNASFGIPRRNPRTSLDEYARFRELRQQQQQSGGQGAWPRLFDNAAAPKERGSEARPGQQEQQERSATDVGSSRTGSILDALRARDGPLGQPAASTTSSGPVRLDAEPAMNIKLGPELGKTVPVDKGRGVGLAQAFRFMEIQTAMNRIRHTVNMQKFHERPGLRRKRLKSQRWRRRFKEGFKETVRKVQKMTRQGW